LTLTKNWQQPKKNRNSGNQPIPVQLGSIMVTASTVGQWGAVTETGSQWHQQQLFW